MQHCKRHYDAGSSWHCMAVFWTCPGTLSSTSQQCWFYAGKDPVWQLQPQMSHWEIDIVSGRHTNIPNIGYIPVHMQQSVIAYTGFISTTGFPSRNYTTIDYLPVTNEIIKCDEGNSDQVQVCHALSWAEIHHHHMWSQGVIMKAMTIIWELWHKKITWFV